MNLTFKCEFAHCIHSLFQRWINSRSFNSAEILKKLFCQIGENASTSIWWISIRFCWDTRLTLMISRLFLRHHAKIDSSGKCLNKCWMDWVKFGEDIHSVWKINPNDFGEWPPFKNQLQVRLFKVTCCNFLLVIKLSLFWISESRFCRVIYRT